MTTVYFSDLEINIQPCFMVVYFRPLLVSIALIGLTGANQTPPSGCNLGGGALLASMLVWVSFLA